MNEKMIANLIAEMITYYKGDPARIQHFIKVHNFSRTIAIAEGMDAGELFTLEAAAVVHDIGIKPSEEKYHSSAGHYQELEGPPVAREMLARLGFSEDVTERVCYLVGHHHTYKDIDGMDYQILVEADFLVNMYEYHAFTDAAGKMPSDDAKQAMSHDARNAMEKIFKTPTGIRFCRDMFAL